MRKIFLTATLFIIVSSLLISCKNSGLETSSADITAPFPSAPTALSSSTAEPAPVITTDTEIVQEPIESIEPEPSHAASPSPSITVPEVEATPTDLITPIDYTYTAKISDDMPEFVFNLRGYHGQSNTPSDSSESNIYGGAENHIESITISCEELSFHQEIKGIATSTPDYSLMPYGFSLNDWDFDGYLDIELRKHQGGTSLNAPAFYWLWDQGNFAFVPNLALEETSSLTCLATERIKDINYVTAYQRHSDGYYQGYYLWQGEILTLVKEYELRYEPGATSNDNYVGHVTIKELADGEMIITEEYDLHENSE